MGNAIAIPLYQRIRNYIDAKEGINLRIVAEKSGIGIKRFYRVMSGASLLLAEEVEKISVNGLGLDPEFFLKKNS